MKHVVGVSGGKDSTALALRLAEVEPRDYTYIATPTGRELPEVFQHLDRLEKLLGKEILRLQIGTLEGVIREQGAIPNPRMRFCTRILKIEPYEKVLMAMAKQGPITSYVGLRADEPLRQGGLWAEVVETRYPLREWGWGLAEVQNFLHERQVEIPKRTDCDWCFFQRLGEWYDLWRDYPDRYAAGEAIEAEMGYTFRSKSRDTWPAGLKELREQFEAGRTPRGWGQGELLAATKCRVCSL